MTTITIERALLEQILNDVCGAKLCEVNSMSSRADQTMTDKFKRWFAGSKVVDADGKPLVVYHGTDQKFTEFKYGEFGFHFGNKEQAESRGDVLMPVYLSIKNPIHFDTDFSSWNEEEIAPYLVKKKIITRKEAGLGDLQGLLMEKGYDGYLYENGYEGGGTSYAVFSPEQIKSAIGNNGDFDPKNPDIRFSRAEVRRLMGSAANAIRAALAPPATAPATTPEKTVKEIMEFVRHYAADTFSSATLEDKIRRSLAAPATAPDEQVRRDAERVAWYENNPEKVLNIGFRWYSRNGYGLPMKRRKGFREAIDAAMKETP